MFTKMYLTILFTVLLVANDTDVEERIESAECMSCHNTEDFTNESEKVTNFNKLHNQVMQCAFSNDAEWFDDETLDVSKYLNKKHYFFKED